MSNRNNVIHALQQVGASEDIIYHTDALFEEETPIIKRVVGEYEDNFENLKNRVPIDGFEVYFWLGAPYAFMNEHFELNYKAGTPLQKLYSNKKDLEVISKIIEENYENNYYIITEKSPSMLVDKLNLAILNNYNAKARWERSTIIFEFEDKLTSEDKSNLETKISSVVLDIPRSEEAFKISAKRCRDSFSNSLLYEIKNGEVRAKKI